MKKIRAFIFIFLIVSLNLSAFEGGGILKTGLNLNSQKSDISLTHFDSLSLWAKQNLDKDGNYNFAVQSSYLMNLKKPIKPNGKLDINHIANLDMFKFSFLIPIGSNSLSIDAGRYNAADITSVILNQNIDGIYIAYEMPKFSTFFNLGYTGLLNSYANPTTATGIKSISKKDTKIYNLAPSFVHMSALFHIPFGALRHAVDLDINSFVATNTPKASNNYASISLNGPIAKGLFYLVSGSVSILTREKKKIGIGVFVSGELNYYFNKYDSKAGLKTQIFCGGRREFTSFTLSNASKVKFMEAKDLWKTSLNGSIKPVKNLFLSTECSFMTYTSSQPKKVGNFAGFEWNTSVNYTILQDIALNADFGMFVEKTGKIDTRLGLKGIISF
ncbi:MULTISPECIES: hypothetical protein [unclassified Treponema]|uniref:hypothetical protein n=1 Tax=unclassified Treponema TaxID=2638727 RepID=UPI0020A3CCB0|nr:MULTISPECIES: hypothetical protein [unclassified Treponema]UTC67783.1 hypothetical protein E4O06_03720 [Treponema sp. OMZ 789]UTC70508.1 hypothetical protein E4O01_03710 [Treponema sp. OMZ 790]UTC73220.1 hypothetical protein E4O02_03860 [Treponema sp. OMZ 791]